MFRAVTKDSRELDTGGEPCEITYWGPRELALMEQRRSAKWSQLVKAGRVPAWLVQWICYCKDLAPQACPDYAHLRSLIAMGEQEAAAARAKAAAARAGAWRVGAAEE